MPLSETTYPLPNPGDVGSELGGTWAEKLLAFLRALNTDKADLSDIPAVPSTASFAVKAETTRVVKQNTDGSWPLTARPSGYARVEAVRVTATGADPTWLVAGDTVLDVVSP